jgi:Asp/Glu/hydantoin racemase
VKKIAAGILMLKTGFPRIQGDIGNPGTFDYPVLYRVVEQVSPFHVLAGDYETIVGHFIDSGKALVGEGVDFIATSCGFLAMFQRQLAGSIGVPVYTSSLLLLPLIYAVTSRPVGILAADEKGLTADLLESVGAADVPFYTEGIKETYFWDVLLHDRKKLDTSLARRDVIEAAKRLSSKTNDLGSVLLECTNFSPFADFIQKALGLPVFDIITLMNMAHEAAKRRSFQSLQ